MLHKLPVFSVLLILSGFQTASAQEWATKMFAETRHDFGTVAKNSKAEFVFELENIYQEAIHISGVRTSCGCVSGHIVKHDLATWEKGQIVAKLNTDAYLGQRSATITVIIDRPYPAEVQLGIAGYIRQDVTLSPGTIRFGSVNEGEGAETHIDISHAGNSGWKITDVRSANQHLDVSLAETQRSGGRVSYRMAVRLKPDAPAGTMVDEIKLVTNDTSNQLISIALEASITASLTASPRLLTFGEVSAETPSTVKLILRGKSPFKVLDVRCDDTRFAATNDGKEARLQVIPITFNGGGPAGTIDDEIEVETSIGTVKVRAQASVPQ